MALPDPCRKHVSIVSMKALVVAALAWGCSSSKPATIDGGVIGQPDAPMTVAHCDTGANTTSPGTAAVTFDVDVAIATSVSPYIYGINNYPGNNYYSTYPGIAFGMMRWGGDAFTDWNWRNNADNVGVDNGFTNTDQFMPYAYMGQSHDTNPSGAIVDGMDSISVTQGRGMAALVTVSLSDYLAASASEHVVQYAPSADFIANTPDNQAAFAATMPVADPTTPVFFSLDNEPNYWKSTHPEVFKSDLAFDNLVERGATYAAAVKGAVPDAKVFGPVVSGVDGFTSLDDYSDLAATNPYATSGTEAIDYYLAGMSARSTAAGKRLLDVLDLHYYNNVADKNGTLKSSAQCEQGPRDYWDATYQTPDITFDDYIQGWKPRALIPRMQAKIDAKFPGTGLAFTEYNNGCEHAIAGGVAQADTLGIFGRYGVFAATVWPLMSTTTGTNWLIGAFGAFRGYGGGGESVGDLALGASTTDPVKTSIYGFAHADRPGLELVAINKTDAPIAAEIRLSNACTVTTGRAFQLTAASASMLPTGGVLTITGNALAYTLPANSVTTIELR
jgi:hypothetical protein